MQAVYRHAVSDAVRRSAVATPSRHLPCLTKKYLGRGKALFYVFAAVSFSVMLCQLLTLLFPFEFRRNYCV